MTKNLIMIISLILLVSETSVAVTMSGINIPESLKLEKRELVLNGIGVRKKFGFKVYYAGFYLPEKTSDHSKIINSDEPQALIMYWKRSADIRKIQSVFLKSLALSAHAPEKRSYNMNSDFGLHTENIRKFVSWVSETDVKKHHVWSFNYTPGKGIDVYVYDTKSNIFKGNIPGLDFKKILWGVWIAENQAVGDQMREDMLGVE